jgi:peptidoglycan-associated lipoprotein
LNQDLSRLRPVFFDYDKSDIRADQMVVLQKDAEILRQMSNKVQIQGHCDERGTEEYNLALGDRRARMVSEYLNSFGIDAARLNTISFGESRPFATEHNEDAWSENRRAHFVEQR